MKETAIDADKTVRGSYFLNHGWEVKQCPCCSKLYFTKRDVENCGSYHCVGHYAFLDDYSPKKFLELSPSCKEITNFFSKRKYKKSSPIEIIRQKERTFFASAAGQIFDDYIYEKRKPSKNLEPIFIAQPVIRLQNLNPIEVREGFSTSFLNVATVHWNASHQDHFRALDFWLDFFSSQGFFVSDVCFIIADTENTWADKKVLSDTLKINYKGLEIGAINYFRIPQNNGKLTTMSDISVGMERFLWAVNKTKSYFDAIGPLRYVIIGDLAILDTIRTLTLMAGSGVIPDYTDQGIKFKSLAKRLSRFKQIIPLYEMVNFYYKQWSEFIEMPYGLEHVHQVIRNEIARNHNVILNKLLRLDFPSKKSDEEFMRLIIRDKRARLDQMREIIKNAKGDY